MNHFATTARDAKPLAPENFRFVADLVRREAAIVLEAGKEYLVETRLASLAIRHGQASVNGLVDLLRCGGPDRRHLAAEIVDALTTNETLFFRDLHPFEALRKVLLPAAIAQRAAQRRLTIWSAACSTGQEPYSIAMLIAEHFPQLADWQVQIIGTDISPTVLKRAREGRYNQLEVNRGLPAPLLIRHFTKDGDAWRLGERILRMVEFRLLNLAEAWAPLPPCDFIFLRNVMIYFDVETKRRILQRVRQGLLPHGTLFLGTAETTVNIDPGWAPRTVGGATVFQPV